jgi:hypothetical protein
VSRREFGPPDGVAPRAVLHIAACEGCFWATVYEDQLHEYAAAWANSTRLIHGEVAGQEGGDNGNNKSLVFDPVSLSWKLGTNASSGWPRQARALGTTRQDAGARGSNYLPRFSRQEGSNSGSDGKGGTSGRGLQAVSGGLKQGRRGGSILKVEDDGNDDRPGGSVLATMLMERNLKLEDSGEGCNVFLALARLLSTAGVEMQGLMFTTFESSNQGSLTGAMSRKARADTKAYIQEHGSVFDKPGQWLGDHDLIAAARLYQIRILFYMVIYNRDVKVHSYDPEPGVEPLTTVHICLDRGLFWPIVESERGSTSLAAAPSSPTDFVVENGRRAADRQVLYLEPAERSRASALDKVLYRFGGRDSPKDSSLVGEPRQVPREDSPQQAGSTSRLDKEREWLSGGEFGEPIIVRGKQPCTAVVVLLHGLGSTGADLEQLALAFRMPWVKFILPTARRSLVAVAKEILPSWFDITPGSLLTQSNIVNSNLETSYRIHSKLADQTAVIDLSMAHIVCLLITVSQRKQRLTKGHILNGRRS